MSNWAAIQASIYSKSSKKAQTLSDMIINAKLSRRDMENIIFIIQMEQMKRNERKEQKKVIQMADYKGQHQGQGPGSAAPPEGQGPGSAAAPPEGTGNDGRQ